MSAVATVIIVLIFGWWVGLHLVALLTEPPAEIDYGRPLRIMKLEHELDIRGPSGFAVPHEDCPICRTGVARVTTPTPMHRRGIPYGQRVRPPWEKGETWVEEDEDGTVVFRTDWANRPIPTRESG